MRTDVLRLCTVAGLLLAWVLPVVAGDRVYDPRKNRQNTADEVIYNLTVPWPFRTARTTEGRAAAVASEPVQTKEEMEDVLINTGLLRTTNIHFAFDSADLTANSLATLDNIGQIFSERPEMRVEISGHCDSTGPEEYNLMLSQRRADAVRSYLIKNFSEVRTEALTAKGYGETMPVASNDTREGRAKNRRVEFKILNQDELARIERERAQQKMASEE